MTQLATAIFGGPWLATSIIMLVLAPASERSSVLVAAGIVGAICALFVAIFALAERSAR